MKREIVFQVFVSGPTPEAATQAGDDVANCLAAACSRVEGEHGVACSLAVDIGGRMATLSRHERDALRSAVIAWQTIHGATTIAKTSAKGETLAALYSELSQCDG